MQSGWDSWDTCSRVNSPLSRGAGEGREVSVVEGDSSNTTEGGTSEARREGMIEVLRPGNGETVGDLHYKQGCQVSYPC